MKIPVYRQPDPAALKQGEAGTPVRQLCREHGISSADVLQVA
jgi:hypothetical protein